MVLHTNKTAAVTGGRFLESVWDQAILLPA